MDFIKRNSLLYKTNVEYGDYTINHILGCAHGCLYPCYAMRMSIRFGRIKTYKDWLKPKLVANSLELLEKEIPKYKGRINSVHLCFMSDPFMVGYPEVSKMSLKIMEILNRHGIKVTTLSKGIYPNNLLHYATNPMNEYGITLVSDNIEFQRKFEPFAAKWRLRLKSLENLSKQGAKTWVSMEPYPTPNIIKQDIGRILNRILFTNRIVFGRLNYNSCSTKYNNHSEFYNDLCHQVSEFCERNNIICHIKSGTFTQPASSHPTPDLTFLHPSSSRTPDKVATLAGY